MYRFMFNIVQITICFFSHALLLEITISPNTSLVSISFIPPKANNKFQPSPNTFLSSQNYRSFLIINVVYVHVIILSLKLNCVSFVVFYQHHVTYCYVTLASRMFKAMLLA